MTERYFHWRENDLCRQGSLSRRSHSRQISLYIVTGFDDVLLNGTLVLTMVGFMVGDCYAVIHVGSDPGSTKTLLSIEESNKADVLWHLE